MKTALLTLFGLLALTSARAQSRPFTFGVSTGTVLALSQPASTPLEVQITGWYNVSPRFAVGAGYEVQRLERLKTHTGNYFAATFTEQLRHNGISFRIGVVF